MLWINQHFCSFHLFLRPNDSLIWFFSRKKHGKSLWIVWLSLSIHVFLRWSDRLHFHLDYRLMVRFYPVSSFHDINLSFGCILGKTNFSLLEDSGWFVSFWMYSSKPFTDFQGELFQPMFVFLLYISSNITHGFCFFLCCSRPSGQPNLIHQVLGLLYGPNQ